MPEMMELLDDWKGYVDIRAKQFSEADIARTIDLLQNAARMPSHRWEYMLREAITTDDFPYLFGQVVDRQLLALYKVAVTDWKSYFKMGTAKDFNLWRSHKVQGNNNLLPLVAEKGEYLVQPVSESRYTGQVYKRGAQFDISWESLINDSLGAFSDIPQRFAEAALYTEAYLATATYASATGPNALLFGAPITDVDGQNVTNLGVLPLTIANLETTMQLMAAQTDVLGRPLAIRGIHLVVPPQLEFTARQILTSTLKMWTESAGGAATPYPMTNVVSQMGLQLHVDPILPIIDVSGTGDTTWYLFADPRQGAAMEFRYLRGHESPEICMKSSDKVTVGGAAISPFAGDFATDNIFYRVRVVCNGNQLDPRFAYAQQAP